MSKCVNAFDILKYQYSVGDFSKMFQNSLYKNYNLIILDDKQITKYDPEEIYKKDDVVYTLRLGEYSVFISLLDENNEPLTNPDAWEQTDKTIITETELSALFSMCREILPASLRKVCVCEDDVNGINKLKYIIGLFVACYLANKNGSFDTASGNGGGSVGRYVVHKSVDGLSASYRVADYLLEENNMFYSGNPYGLEILSLKNKLFTTDLLDMHENIFLLQNWRYGKQYFPF